MSIQRRAGNANSLRDIVTPAGLDDMDKVLAELDGYISVITGRTPPPHDNGVLTLQETGDAYYARAREIEGLIYRGERDGNVAKNSPWYKFRTGELGSYIALFSHASALGSRRVTAAVEFREDEVGE